MQYLTKWKIRPGCVEAAAKRFLESGGAPMPEGVTLLGRWHATDMSCGFSLSESDDPAASYRLSLTWGDLLELETHPVVGDDVAGAALAERFGS